jgi:spermidine synthase
MLRATMSTSLEAPTPGPRVFREREPGQPDNGRDPHPAVRDGSRSEPPTRGVFAAIFLISAATLLLELTLTRIFDVVLWTNLANFIVSSAIFGLGLGGIAVMLRPSLATGHRPAGWAALAFAVAVLLLLPAVTLLPFDFGAILTQPVRQLVSFAALYAALLAPFFASGVVIASILTRHARRVDHLYFWDLLGAGLGALGIIWLPTLIGPAAMLVLIAAAGVVVAGLLAPSRSRTRVGVLCLTLGLLGSALFASDRIDFQTHVAKGTLQSGDALRQAEYSRWDPAAKIDVLPYSVPFLRRIAYDGGAQRSSYYQFDGDLGQVRARYFDLVDNEPRYAIGRYVALAYWLKRDTPMRALVIGSAGGQEVLAALAFGAARVDAVEMVCAVIQAARGPYATFTGHLYDHPRVHPVCDEGRSYLRHTPDRYDVIQIHSNHTTSSVAQGAGAMDPVYLQTVEAYREYLSRLSDDGILQMNYYVYPRMLTTAAQAWHDLFPDRDFARHVIIEGSGWAEFLMPTMLIKRSPWTLEEIAAIRRFVSPDFAAEPGRTYGLVYAPVPPEVANVPAEFFRAPLDPALAERLPYQVAPTTDARPFFRDLRKHLHRIEPDAAGYVPASTVGFINASLMGPIPRDRIHLYLLGGLSVAMSGLFLWYPLRWMRRHGLGRTGALPTAVYFGALGVGFIVVEVVLISKFVVLIGFPIYAMAAVLCTLLIAAGVGSRLSGWLWRRRPTWAIGVFPAVALLIAAVVAAFPYARDLALGLGQPARIALSAALLLPLGVALGMPFPLGIAALSRLAPRLVPWAWGVNGFMTVVGSLIAALLSIRWGFDVTLLAGATVYLVAMGAWRALDA